MDYTTLSLAAVRTELEDVARDSQTTFGGLGARQLNWRPDAARWSVAQCFEHLLAANRLMFQAAQDALNDARREPSGSACRSSMNPDVESLSAEQFISGA